MLGVTRVKSLNVRSNPSYGTSLWHRLGFGFGTRVLCDPCLVPCLVPCKCSTVALLRQQDYKTPSKRHTFFVFRFNSFKRMSFVAIRRVASVAAKQAPFRALSGGPEIPTEAALSYCAKDAVAKVSIFKSISIPPLCSLLSTAFTMLTFWQCIVESYSDVTPFLHIFAQSCFLNIDFKIAEDVPVYEAIKR